MARYNLQIKVGTYTGNATAGRVIDVGFVPTFVLVKGYNGGSAFTTVLFTRTMTRDLAAIIGGASAHAANCISSLSGTGFEVGTNSNANSSGSTYFYLAIRGTHTQNIFRTGRYVGNGNDNRNLTGSGLNFQPDYLGIKGNNATNGAFTTKNHGADSTSFYLAAAAADNIQSLASSQFQLGTSTSVNASGIFYDFFAIKELAGTIKVGSYVGDGTDDRNITGLGFQPDFVLTKDRTAANQARMIFTGIGADTTFRFAATANASNELQSFLSDGFQVGSAAAVNGNGVTIDYLAMKAGNYELPVTRNAT